MTWAKFTSRKFLLVFILLIVAIINAIAPGFIHTIPWQIIALVLGYVLCQTGIDIVKRYLDWTKPKSSPKKRK